MKIGDNNIIKNSIIGNPNYKSPYRKLWRKDKEKDKMYDVDIHVWRHPGMGNSLQTITGNEISILTALASLFETLMRETDITKENLNYALEMAYEQISSKNKN